MGRRHHGNLPEPEDLIPVGEPTVDVIIGVHTAERPIERAVTSVLNGTKEAVRVTVVCHNVDRSLISARLGELAHSDSVRLMELHDGIHSPAGPFNLGLDAATAPFTAMLDSDDTLEPGAIDSWMRRQRKDGAEIVIPTLTYARGGSPRTPPTRPFRTRRLDGVRDRLAYRTRQLGLVARERFHDVRVTAGLKTGEDVEQGVRLWFSDASISFDRGGPSYVIHLDDDDRTSASAKPVDDDFAFLDAILGPARAPSLSSAQRDALIMKIARTHLMDAAASRFSDSQHVPTTEKTALAAVAERLVIASPVIQQILSRRDARILRQVLDGAPDEEQLRAELALRKDFRRPSNLLSASARYVLHREAPLRFLAATALA